MLYSVVVCVAHPDDETILAGGTLALLTSQNVEVKVVCATRGEGGELGEPPLTTCAELGQVREAEMRCAAEALNVKHVDFLGYVDPKIEGENGLRPFEAPYERLVNQIYSALHDADLVLGHGKDGEYGHPAHKLMYSATLDAVQRSDRSPLFYSVAAFVPGIEDILWNPNEQAHFALDIRPWLDAKERAALCHRTQHALFKRHEKLETVREALRTVESFRRQFPLAKAGPPDDPFAAMLQAAGAWACE